MSAQGSGNCQIFTPNRALAALQQWNTKNIVQSLINNTLLPNFVNNVKTISYQQLSSKTEYQTIKNRIDEDIKNNRDNLKILIFPAKGTDCNDQTIQDREIFFINNGTNTYMITELLAPSRSLRSVYLHITGAANESNAQIVGDNFVIAGHADDNVVFKIPWKQEWGKNGLPESNDVIGFNTLYEKIKQQQNQTANITNNQNPQNQMITTPAVPKINIIVNYNGIHIMPGFDPNTPISELIMQIRKKFKKENVEVIYCDKYSNQKKLDVNSTEKLSSVFGNTDRVSLMVNDKKIGVQPQTILNNNQTSQSMIRTGYDNGLEANGTATVNKQPVQVRVPMVKTVPVPRPAPVLVPPVRPTVVPVRPFVPVVPVRTNQSVVPKFVPVKAQTTFRPPQFVNNNPFGGQTTTFNGQTTGYRLGLRTFQGLKTGQPPFVRPLQVVPKLVPVKTVVGQPPKFVPQPVTVPAPPRSPVVPVPVVPVPQSGDGRPEPDTYYVLQGYTKNMNTQVTNWSPQPTQRIPMDYQTYINQNIHGAQPFRQNWRPQYQYCDELGMIFESDSPIYKDAKNNLVTLGNARYRTP